MNAHPVENTYCSELGMHTRLKIINKFSPAIQYSIHVFESSRYMFPNKLFSKMCSASKNSRFASVNSRLRALGGGEGTTYLGGGVTL